MDLQGREKQISKNTAISFLKTILNSEYLVSYEIQIR